MPKVFGSIDEKDLQVELPNGREMPLEELVSDYERLLMNENNSKKAISFEQNKETSKGLIMPRLEVDKWFLINRDVIDKNQENIKRQCYEVGDKGIELYERFDMSNQIADANPDQYPCLIETFIPKKNWEYKNAKEMREMCEKIGEGMYDEVICDFELQMRICNGESVDDLIKKPDKLPNVRVIKLRDGVIGYFGGGAVNNYNHPPAYLYRNYFFPYYECCTNVPYAFRRVASQN